MSPEGGVPLMEMLREECEQLKVRLRLAEEQRDQAATALELVSKLAADHRRDLEDMAEQLESAEARLAGAKARIEDLEDELSRRRERDE